ncbi:DoxX-like family protein [Lewinella sp. W8]|uniref:DoxX-like family protein n=1 Tax=Lewinella sp. W8 TaxID=2528208 RepID=UPI001068681C|nr:DoxX-like family protein [Lewinella sp. W8]MTB50225.1 hypothetical protein [Lewinella sp. W8]
MQRNKERLPWGNFAIALVWLLNGLLAKVMGLVPRHEAIVGEILGSTYSRELTLLIGLGEMALAGWIVVGKFPKQTAIGQIIIILSMNALETLLAPEWLLWGRWNFLFALIFCGFIYLEAFYLRKSQQST